jgi:predicted nucleic acid-binding protein
MRQAAPPLLLSEPVLTETVYFLREERLSVGPLFQMVERRAVEVAFSVSAHWTRLRALMARYDRMDLADASVVVMSEIHERAQVLTIDRRDFSIYRRHDRQVIPFVAPPSA